MSRENTVWLSRLSRKPRATTSSSEEGSEQAAITSVGIGVAMDADSPVDSMVRAIVYFLTLRFISFLWGWWRAHHPIAPPFAPFKPLTALLLILAVLGVSTAWAATAILGKDTVGRTCNTHPLDPKCP